jgi:hypothetical protein
MSARRALYAAVMLAIALVAVALPLVSSVAAAGPTSLAAVAPAHPTGPSGFLLPFAAGHEYQVTQGWNSDYSHDGIAAFAYDFGMPEGASVLAAAAGVVANVHDGEKACGGPELLNHANYVTINHDDGTSTLYAHLSKVEVTAGQVVGPGEEIGLAGSTGFTSCQSHLHFALQAQGEEHAITQSQPIYFDEYPGVEFRAGFVAKSTNEGCALTPTTIPTSGFCGTYYRLPGVTPGTSTRAGATGAASSRVPYFSRLDHAISFDWTKHGPGGYWLDTTDRAFSAHWVGKVRIAKTGAYDFTLHTSGHAVVRVDGAKVLDIRTTDASPAHVHKVPKLTAGSHVIVVDYRSGAEAAVRLGWAPFVEPVPFKPAIRPEVSSRLL